MSSRFPDPFRTEGRVAVAVPPTLTPPLDSTRRGAVLFGPGRGGPSLDTALSAAGRHGDLTIHHPQLDGDHLDRSPKTVPGKRVPEGSIPALFSLSGVVPTRESTFLRLFTGNMKSTLLEHGPNGFRIALQPRRIFHKSTLIIMVHVSFRTKHKDLYRESSNWRN